mmetsp:Transcript_29296/g.69742  ORF Transcript_29296/g.69742 Transcript_29296/m.69742 type:complete len:905 (+) Transcript_29296:90-2804(+)
MLLLVSLSAATLLLCTEAFTSVPASRSRGTKSGIHSSLPTTPPQEQALDNYIPPSHPLHELIFATDAACEPRDTEKDAQREHNASSPPQFRYEWGTWIDAELLDRVVVALENVRLITGAYDDILDGGIETTTGEDSLEDQREAREKKSAKESGRTVSIASSKYWDVILHVLPKGARVEKSWPEGSWAVLKPLTGLVEIAKLRGPDRDGFYKKLSPRDLRGGGDGSGSVGGGTGQAEGYSTSGEEAIKLLGGPLRGYTGKAVKSTMLEIVVRPPIEVNVDSAGTIGRVEWSDVEKVLTKAVPIDTSEEEEDSVQTEDNPKAAVESSQTSSEGSTNLNEKMGLEFTNVGGLDGQLADIARRVLASRANPEAARRLGVGHVRGLLLSGPPGCGKTLLARELSRLLGAREPQIVNGPEILDKFIGEAERRVRELFKPAEREYEEVGDASALHIIILDEMDAIARKRGSMTSDTTGVRDSVVNQLLAKIDGVKEAPNILVVGLTNRPELLDPALLRPGRLEVQLRIELPDRLGRRDILRIHTRKMREDCALGEDAIEFIESTGDEGLGSLTDKFSGAELAGLVRSAASFALARAVESDSLDSGKVLESDLKQALEEVRPALGTDDELLRLRHPYGISHCNDAFDRILRDLDRFTAPVSASTPRLHSLLLVGAGGGVQPGGTGTTALASHAAAEASVNGHADYVRFITALDILTAEGGGGDEARATALVEKFSEAREMSRSLLVLDDVDQICSGSGADGYSTTMISTVRALLRTPPPSSNVAKAGGHSSGANKDFGKTFHIIATTSRSDAACSVLRDVFEETIVVPLLDAESVEKLLRNSLEDIADPAKMAGEIVAQLGPVGCKSAIRVAERAIITADDGSADSQTRSLQTILGDLRGDMALASASCEIR